MRAAYWLLFVAACPRLATSQTVAPKLVTVPELKTILSQDHGTFLVQFTSTDMACLPCLESNSQMPGIVGAEHWVHPFLRVSWPVWTAPPPGLAGLTGMPMLVIFVNGKAVKDYVGYSQDKEDEVRTILRPFNHGPHPSVAPPPVATGPPSGLLRFADLSATDTDTTCAITDNRHQIYCWGNAANNRIFAKYAPNAKSYSAPVQIQPGEIPPNAKITSLAIGKWAICALTDTGRVYCWGDSAQRAVPTAMQAGEIPPGTKLSNLAVGVSQACAIGTDSQVYCWGPANPAKPEKMVLGEIPPNEKLTAIGVSFTSDCVLADGDAYCWLNGERPQLVSPGDVPASVKLTTLSLSDDEACALGDDGRAYCFRQTRNGLPVWKLLPSQFKLNEFTAQNHCAIAENHRLYCAGKPIPSIVRFQKVVCAPNHCAALTDDGRIYSWGTTQSEAELGHPANPDPTFPQLINTPR